MHPHKILPILLLLLMFGCSTARQTGISSNTPDDSLKIESLNQYRKDQVIEIRVHNTSEHDTLILYKPRNLRVQRRQGSQWARVRTLYCPCGASCPAPPERVPVLPGSSYTYRWDQKEQWCGKMNQQGISEMHSQFPGFGQYRLVIQYILDKEQQIRAVYATFAIK